MVRACWHVVMMGKPGRKATKGEFLPWSDVFDLYIGCLDTVAVLGVRFA